MRVSSPRPPVPVSPPSSSTATRALPRARRRKGATNMKTGINESKLDASESVFFARELEEVRAKTYDIKYENLKALTFVPIDTSIDPAVESITYRQYDSVGVAKWIASYAKDFPRADVKAVEFTTKVR